MKLIYCPQRADFTVDYTFDGERVTATVTLLGEEHVDTFDFSQFTDGIVYSEGVETTLPYNPIVMAERRDGELTVSLIHWYGRDAKDWEKETREETV